MVNSAHMANNPLGINVDDKKERKKERKNLVESLAVKSTRTDYEVNKPSLSNCPPEKVTYS